MVGNSRLVWRLTLGGLLSGALHAGAAGVVDVYLPAEMDKAVSTSATLTTLGTGFGWIEGPVWVPQQGGYLIFSDQSNKRMHKWSAAQGVTVFRNPSNNANGNTLDLNERLITCETDTRRVSLTDTNGDVRVIVSSYNGKAFNSPNDVVIKSDGTAWFTDPNYGLGPMQPGRYVYRFEPTNGNATVTALVTDFVQPNGICFSPDEKRLYVADSDNSRRHIRVFDVAANNTLANGRVFCTITNGVPDGIRCDVDGRVWSSAKDGVYIYLPDGRLAGKIRIPNTVANVAFGGTDWRTLYIVAQPNLYSIPLKVAGTPSMKKLRFAAVPGELQLVWPAPSTGFQLEARDNLNGADVWTAASEPSTISNSHKIVAIRTTNTAGFYRLKKLGN